MLGKRKRKVLLQALLSFLFILLVFCGAWYFAVTYKPPSTKDYLERSITYLDEWASELGVETTTRKSIYWDFIDEDNSLVPLIGYDFSLGTVEADGIDQYADVDSDHLEKINNKFFKPLLDDSKKYFTKSRFIEDKKNSRDKEADPAHPIRRAYQRGKIYCLLHLTPQSDPFGNFFCGIIDEKQIALQKKVKGLFSTAYNPKKFLAFRVTKIEKDFALGIVMDNIQGYTWIAKKEEGGWKIIWKGQIPLCSEMEEKSIPKSIYLKCFAQENIEI
jgi:hypothetical protein